MDLIFTLAKFMILDIVLHGSCAVDTYNLEVQTVPTVSLESGKETSLACGYNRTVYAVYWRYKTASSPLELLVVLDHHYRVGERSGPGYDKGHFNITDNYSLIIHGVKAQDEGTYICEVSDFTTGHMVRNYTEVSVIVMAQHPFLRIGQCEGDFSGDEKHESCVLHTYTDQHIVELTCTIVRVKPMVELSWTPSDQVGKVMNESSMKNREWGDGISDQTLTVSVDTSKFQSDIQHYTCIAKGLAVSGRADQIIAIYITKNKAPTAAMLAGLSAGIIMILVRAVTTIICFVWRKYVEPARRTRQADAKLTADMTLIRDYPSDKPTTSDKDNEHITLGVFGLAKSGKSSLINNMKFALNGFYPTETDGGATGAKEDDITFRIEEIELTNNIKILNYKGMVNDDLDQIEKFFDKIKGPLADNTRQTQIDCPIFVCEHRNYMNQSKEIRKSLAEDVCRCFGRGLMVVITNAGELGECSTMKAELIQTNVVPDDHILIFENYKKESIAVRSSKLLDFILRCLKVAEENKTFRKINKIEDCLIPNDPQDENSPFI